MEQIEDHTNNFPESRQPWPTANNSLVLLALESALPLSSSHDMWQLSQNDVAVKAWVLVLHFWPRTRRAECRPDAEGGQEESDVQGGQEAERRTRRAG